MRQVLADSINAKRAASLIACFREYQGAPRNRRSREDSALAARLCDLATASGVWACLTAALDHVLQGSADVPDIEPHLPGLSEEDRLRLASILFQQLQHTKILVLPNADGAYWAPELSGLPLNREAVAEFFQELNDDYLKASAKRHTLGDARRPFAYQVAALEGGSFDCRSPFSGRMVSNPAAFLVPARSNQYSLLYLFRDGDDCFVLTTDYLYGAITGMYLPKYNIVLTRENARHWSEAIGELRAFMAVMPHSAIAQITFEGARPVALAYGIINHFGHTVFDELEAYHQCAAKGLFARVDTVVRGSTIYFHHDHLFPELGQVRVVDPASEPRQYRALLEKGYMLVRPTCGSHWFSTGLRERFLQAAPKFKVSRPHAEMLTAASGCWPLIWIEIRTNDRCWVEQIDGIVQLTKHLHQEYPKLGIILAGWSVPGVTPASRADRKSVASDLAVTEVIKQQLGQSIPVFDITGVDTPEKVLWSLKSHTFVAAYSSGIIFPVCIAHNRGVLHSGNYVQRLALESMPSGEFSFVENDHAHIFIHPRKIVDVPGARVEAEANYHLDWRDIYDPLLAILRSGEVRRGAGMSTDLTQSDARSNIPAMPEAPPARTQDLPDEKEQAVAFLLSVANLASALSNNKCFAANRIGVAEWTALLVLQRGSVNVSQLARVLGVARKRAKDLIRSLVSERLIEMQTGDDDKDELTISAAGKERLNTVSECLYKQVSTVAGGNFRRFARSPRALRLLGRAFASESADDMSRVRR